MFRKMIAALLCLLLCPASAAFGEGAAPADPLAFAVPPEYASEFAPEERSEEEMLEAEIAEALAEVAESEAIPDDSETFRSKDVYNILLIGSDERTHDFSDSARGDTCMLFSINKNDGKIRIASFERAIGVKILDGVYKGKWDWLTHTFRYGGAELMVREISESFSVEIDCYVRVNLYVFVALIDAIGGIDIELTSAEASYLNKNGKFMASQVGAGKDVQKVQKGMNHLNGATALGYARTRKIDSDWKRIQRQRKVIIAAMEQLSQSSPVKLVSILTELLPMVKTDITAGQIAELLTLLPQFLHPETEEMTIPVKGTYGSMKGMGGRSLYSLDFKKNAKALREFIYGE